MHWFNFPLRPSSYMQAKCFHLLPPLRLCLGTPAQYLGHFLGRGSSSGGGGEEPRHLGHRDPQVVAAWLSALTHGQMSKAVDTGSVAFDLALACLGTALLDMSMQQQHGDTVSSEDAVLSVVQRGGGEASAIPGVSTWNTSRRANLAASVVQQAEVEVLQALVKVSFTSLDTLGLDGSWL